MLYLGCTWEIIEEPLDIPAGTATYENRTQASVFFKSSQATAIRNQSWDQPLLSCIPYQGLPDYLVYNCHLEYLFKINKQTKKTSLESQSHCLRSSTRGAWETVFLTIIPGDIIIKELENKSYTVSCYLHKLFYLLTTKSTAYKWEHQGAES